MFRMEKEMKKKRRGRPSFCKEQQEEDQQAAMERLLEALLEAEEDKVVDDGLGDYGLADMIPRLSKRPTSPEAQASGSSGSSTLQAPTGSHSGNASGGGPSQQTGPGGAGGGADGSGGAHDQDRSTPTGRSGSSATSDSCPDNHFSSSRSTSRTTSTAGVNHPPLQDNDWDDGTTTVEDALSVRKSHKNWAPMRCKVHTNLHNIKALKSLSSFTKF